ncbi:MAG: SPOR domain-containing protein [Balneolales bacterium]|nr:SPOR domain-containing protein [Balneolales bacterium]
MDTTVSTPEAPVTPPPPQAPPRSSQPSYMELISDTGNFTVQVAANRNRYMAERTLNKWHSDGFEPAFIAVEGDEETGDIWYRVFFGRYSNFKDAEAMSEILRNTFERDAFPRRYNR